MDDHTDADLEAIVAETLRPFLGEPATPGARDWIEAALLAAGLRLDRDDPVEIDPRTGDVLVRTADGREARWGSREFVPEDRGWGGADRDPFPDDTHDDDDTHDE